MARIPDDVIEQVRDSADLLEVVQESVQLKRQGSDWRGPCPFHGGTNRNFAVIPKKNLYYCFVCHEAGDVFTWYQKRFGLDYPSSVREVARKVGIVIPEPTERAGPDPREPLYQACEVAQGWFATQLRGSTEAEGARRYLLDRHIELDAAAELGLGYAPKQQAFVTAMRELGITEEVLVEAALAGRREDGTLYPRFRGRLIFPIHDLRGRVVGFGGRILGSGEPKYLNSPETPIFHKGEQLYHMHLAKHAIRKSGFAILVEGYFDVQRLALAGLDQTVAPLGTAFTEAQATLLKRFTAEVVILYDSDGAGLKATFRAGDVLLAHGVRVRVATMPSGEDPDTLVERGGAEALAPILDDAVDLLERKLQLLERKGWFADVRKARESLDRLLPTLRAATDSVTRELYVSRVAERLGIPREVVTAEVAAKTRTSTISRQAPPLDQPSHGSEESRAGRPTKEPRTPGAEIERKLLRLILTSPTWLARAREELPLDRFTVPTFARIYDALLALADDAPIGDALATLDSRAQDTWQRLLEVPPPGGEGYDVDQEYAGALIALEEIHQFPDMAAESDSLVRNRRWRALSPEGQARFRMYLATATRPRARRDDSPTEE